MKRVFKKRLASRTLPAPLMWKLKNSLITTYWLATCRTHLSTRLCLIAIRLVPSTMWFFMSSSVKISKSAKKCYLVTMKSSWKTHIGWFGTMFRLRVKTSSQLPHLTLQTYVQSILQRTSRPNSDWQIAFLSMKESFTRFLTWLVMWGASEDSWTTFSFSWWVLTPIECFSPVWSKICFGSVSARTAPKSTYLKKPKQLCEKGETSINATNQVPWRLILTRYKICHPYLNCKGSKRAWANKGQNYRTELLLVAEMAVMSSKLR